jgi:hypothetical protein
MNRCNLLPAIVLSAVTAISSAQSRAVTAEAQITIGESPLQTLIDATPAHGTLDISGETYELAEQIVISNPLTLIARGTRFVVVNYEATNFPDNAALFVPGLDVTIDGLTIVGPGVTGNILAGIRTVGPKKFLSNMDIRLFQYALYFLDRCDQSVISGCDGVQDAAVFGPETWVGLDYGIVLNQSAHTTVKRCSVQGTRHALIIGEGCSFISVEKCDLSSTANVNTLGIKPTAADCFVIDNEIVGGMNIGGTRMRVQGNTIRGRDDYSQSSVPFFNATLSSANHIVTGNFIQARTVPNGTARLGVCNVFSPPPGLSGAFLFENNHIEIKGSAPVVTGDTALVYGKNFIVRR